MAAEGGHQMVDARGPEDFAKGHIEGAVNIPFRKVVDWTKGTMRPAEDRKKAFEETGVDLSKPVTLSC